MAEVPRLMEVAPFTDANRRQVLELLNARTPGSELDFDYDTYLRAIDLLEDYARQYKGASDADSLRDVFRLLVAASGHDIHEVRQRANLAMERVLSPKEFDAPLATRFVTLKAGDTYHFSNKLRNDREYFVRLYPLQGEREFCLQREITHSDVELTWDEAS